MGITMWDWGELRRLALALAMRTFTSLEYFERMEIEELLECWQEVLQLSHPTNS